jgi:AAA+ ATPase superfamily predicted ATPase
MKENSPFTPGSPVPIELFVGRRKEISEILQYVRNTSSGRQENIFLTGERAIGKSSLACFLRELTSTKEHFLCIHVHLGGAESVEKVVYHIFDSILKETFNHSLFTKLSEFFKDHVKSADLFGINIVFNPPKDKLEDLKLNFPQALKNVIDKIQGEKRGIFIILDDINGLTGSQEFANWYKSFVDYIATHYEQFPVIIMPVGLPEQKNALGEQQESLLRIFRPIHIDKLSEDEVREFFIKAFKKVNIKIENDAMKVLVQYSSGLPTLMHEIGDAIYWNDDDQQISEVDALIGVSIAADRVGQKYLNQKIYHVIRSGRYKTILSKIGSKFSSQFTKSEVEKNLTPSEKKVFNNFLRRMSELGVIIPDKEQERGTYKFVNELYALYIYFVSTGLKVKK